MHCGPVRGRIGRCDIASESAPTESAPTPRERMHAALVAAGAAARAKFAACQRSLTPAETEVQEAYWQHRTEQVMRAKDAQREKRQARRARDGNPAPAPTKLWSKPMSLQAAMDTRLTMGARVALQAIRSLTGRQKRVSRNGLAVLLGVHPRTAQRYISELRDRGYIRTRLIANALGWVIAQLIEITEKVLPKHHRPRLAATLADGLARCVQAVPQARNGGKLGEAEAPPSKSEYEITIGRRPGAGFGAKGMVPA